MRFRTGAVTAAAIALSLHPNAAITRTEKENGVRRPVTTIFGCALIVAMAISLPATAEDWPNWRGPARNGTSAETGLISSWSPEGENLIWRNDFVGRSTPVVFDGRVCASGRSGEGITRQEMVACFDAESGEKLWDYRFNVYHTSVPWNRVGWGGVTGDPETGYIYHQGVAGWFHAFDSKTGEVVWSRSFIEEYGFMEGYGGRTQTALIDEDRVVITFSSTSWGPEGRPLHRIRAFDKRTGEQLWVSQPASSQADKNTQSTPNVAVVDGQRLVVAGNGGGGIYGVQARTGTPVWGFQLSKRGINVSVVTEGDRVYGSHSEENMDSGDMGRVVAINATGSGDVTQSEEAWRLPLGAGFSSPALHDGRLYVVDNSANLHAIDAKSGEHLWELNFGRVGKPSPVYADGKIYVTEVNGRVVIIEPGETEGKILDSDVIKTPDGRDAEIYSSVAIAYGRIYFTTEEGIYCLGDKNRPFEVSASMPAELPKEGRAGVRPATLQVVPADIIIAPGDTVNFRVKAFDEKGREMSDDLAVTWSLEGLEGELSKDGTFTAASEQISGTGHVAAHIDLSDRISAGQLVSVQSPGTRSEESGRVKGKARVRQIQDLPIEETFNSIEPGARPGYQMAYGARFGVEELEGERVMAKGPSPIKIHRHITFFGRPDHSDYTIQGDLMGTKAGRKVGDIGLINSGYTMELLGGYQAVQVRSWQSELRMMQQIDFPWEFGTWYTMKLKVEEDGGKAMVRGKVWPRGEDEPEDWTITVEDPLPIRQGARGALRLLAGPDLLRQHQNHQQPIGLNRAESRQI